MKNIIRFFILLLAAEKLTAQTCIVADTCPVAPVQICDITNNSEQLWNETYWLDIMTGLHDLPDAPVDLTFTATDTCVNGSITIKFILFLDLDGNGTLETAVGSDSLPGFNMINYGNTGGAGTLRSFDERPVSADQKYGFALETIVNGPTTTARVRWNTAAQPDAFVHPELPYGLHKIRWIISDVQGQESICEYDFVVTDCKAPTVVCLNGLSVNIMATSQVKLWAWDFLQYAEDNHTPANQLQLGIRMAGAGTGFPLDSAGNPATHYTFRCDELGYQPIELWGRDLNGNTYFCETEVLVTDYFDVCSGGNPVPQDVLLCVNRWCDQSPVGGISYNFGLPDTLYEAASCAYFENTALSNDYYSVPPSKAGDDLNGVNVLDLIRIAKHILGLQPLGSPYAMIAADANRSNSITTFDIVEYQKLIQGVYTELPNNTSWIFIDANYVFPNPLNPFQGGGPDTLSYTFQDSIVRFEFFGIKTGDVDCSGMPGFDSNEADDRNAALLKLPDAMLLPGEIIEVPVRLSESVEWLGFQMGLRFDPGLLEAEAVVPGNLPGMDGTSFARPQPGMLNTVWFDAVPRPVLSGERLFAIKLKALAPVRLSEAISMATGDFTSEAYSANETSQKLHLQFTERSEPTGTTAIFPPQPNPTTAGTTIPLRLGQDETVTLELADLSGKRLWLNQITLPAGTHSCEIPAAAMPQAGMYVWRIQAGTMTASGKLVRI